VRISRCFVEHDLAVDQLYQADANLSHYLHKVLRLKNDDVVSLFNGQGGEYHARIKAYEKGQRAATTLAIFDFLDTGCESALQLTLVQAISRPEHMSYALQKAVELGVQRIVPLWTQRTQHINPVRLQKRHQRWQTIIQQACAQCGRNTLPTLTAAYDLSTWLEMPLEGIGLVPDPDTQNNGLPHFTPKPTALTVLVGAEGGISTAEQQQISQAGYYPVRLGPRILRTETATLSILSLCQAQWGDL